MRMAAVATLLAGACACADVHARELASDEEIHSKAALIAESARHRTRADRAAARALIAQGNAAYRAGRFDEAHRDYDNAAANAPSAYAYIMTGDAHWRAALASARQPGAAGEASTCRLQRLHFVDDLRLDLNQQYLIGLRLAQTTALAPRPGPALRARARTPQPSTPARCTRTTAATIPATARCAACASRRFVGAAGQGVVTPRRARCRTGPCK
jgi:hypothetical protein